MDDSGLNFKYQDQVNAPNGNDGICETNCPTQLAQSESVVTAAQLFDGSTEGILVPAAVDYDWSATAGFSIELWVKKDTAVASGGEVLVARKDPDSQMMWKVEVTQAGAAKFSLISTGGQGAAFSATGSKIINNGRWHHIVAMRDAASKTNVIYVDGQYDGGSAAITYAAGFDSATGGPTMGWIDVAGQEERFSGSLDEVALYSRALTDAEIAAHYYLARGYCNIYDTRTRVLPLGDSITYGHPGMDSYRLTLWNAMAANSYYMDFVGSETDGSVSSYDRNHAGFGGLSTAGLFSLMNSGFNPDVSSIPAQVGRFPGEVTNGPFLNFYPADVVLLHIGTNDLTSSFNSQSITQVANVLDQIDAFSENITVVLALIINRRADGNQTFTSQFNNALDNMAQTRIANGDKIIVMDLEHDAGLNYTIGSADFSDTLHPTSSGYTKMSAVWLTGLESFMPQFTAPQIQPASATLVATLGRPFEYKVQSDGAPAPSFSLLNRPDSTMAINASTGIVSWTPSPQTTGPATFTVQATNSIPTGTATRTLTSATDSLVFDVSLNHAPNAVGESYTTETDGSLTIAAAAGVLANDTDQDSDPLTAGLVSTVAHGTLTLNSNGSFSYVSDGSGATTDAFTYKADDGNAATEATVAITITKSNNTPASSDGGGGGGGGGCFISASGGGAVAASSRAAGWGLFALGLAIGFCVMTRRRRQNRTVGRTVGSYKFG